MELEEVSAKAHEASAQAVDASAQAAEAGERADHAMNGSRMAQSNAEAAIKRTMALEAAMREVCSMITVAGNPLSDQLAAWLKATPAPEPPPTNET